MLRWSEMSDEQLVARASAELRILLPDVQSPNDALVQRWPNGLPQYCLGHDVLVATPGPPPSTLAVTLCGNAYDGVGIPASVGSGRRAGREALEMVQLSYR